MKNRFLALLLLFFLLPAQYAYATTVTPTESFYVNDAVGILSDLQKSEMTTASRDLYETNSVQVVTVIVDEYDGNNFEAYANDVFNDLGIGSAEDNNGIMLLVSVDTGDVRIEVGGGVSDILPDSKSGRVLDETFLPDAMDDNLTDAIYNTHMELVSIGSEATTDAPSQHAGNPNAVARQPEPESNISSAFFIALIVFIVIIAMIIYTNKTNKKKNNNNNNNNQPPTGGGVPPYTGETPTNSSETPPSYTPYNSETPPNYTPYNDGTTPQYAPQQTQQRQGGGYFSVPRVLARSAMRDAMRDASQQNNRRPPSSRGGMGGGMGGGFGGGGGRSMGGGASRGFGGGGGGRSFGGGGRSGGGGASRGFRK